MWQQWRPALRLTLVMTFLTGLVYPAMITGLAQLLFPDQANGSLERRDGRVIGSRLIGQQFSRPEYFHPRPSAAGGGYDAMASGGSNLGPTSRGLAERVGKAVAEYRGANPGFRGPVPGDAVTTSGSGLDPHITPANAEAQIARVAAARAVEPERIREMVRGALEPRELGLLGEPRVNVLKLNLELDARYGARR